MAASTREWPTDREVRRLGGAGGTWALIRSMRPSSWAKEESRGSKLPDLHGLERRERCRFGGRSELGMDLVHDPLLGTQVDLLDDASVAIDPGGADPVEIGLSFLPLGDQAGHNGNRVIPFDKYINKYLKNG